MAQDEVEQRREVLARAVDHLIRPALAAGGVEHGEVELLIRRVEGGEEVEDFVVDLLVTGVLTVDLVDDDDGLDAARQGLAEHEFGLRQHAFGSVNQQDGAIDHGEDALHLAAEIGVAGGVDDVELHTLPFHGRALGQDGDAALALEVIAVHGALGHGLVFAEGSGLFEQLIEQCGLAVVNVRDDGEVTHGHMKRAFRR